MNTRTEKWLNNLAATMPAQYKGWQRTRWGFINVCACCGGLLSVTVSQRKVREVPHCIQRNGPTKED